MKKIFTVISILFVSTFCFAKHIFSLNVGPSLNFMGGNMNGQDAYLTDIHFSLLGEYNYLFKNNLLVGVRFGAGIGGITDTRNDSTLNASITNINYSPEFGIKFGRKHLFTLMLLPFDSSYSFAYEGIMDLGNYKVNLDYEAVYYTISSGLKMNFQWGNKTCRNGFFVGLYLPWLKTITNGTLNNNSLADKGLTFPLSSALTMDFGYRISFVK